MSGRRVFLGSAKGETPRKTALFWRDEAPSNVGNATPLRQEQMAGLPLKSALSKSAQLPAMAAPLSNATPDKVVLPSRMPERPTTSRGKAQPSPDEFTNYIQQSPQSKIEFERGASTVMSFADDHDGAMAHRALKFDAFAVDDTSTENGVGSGDGDDDDRFKDFLNNPFRGDHWGDSFDFRAGQDEDVEDEDDDEDSTMEITYGKPPALNEEQLKALRGCWLFGIGLQV